MNTQCLWWKFNRHYSKFADTLLLLQYCYTLLSKEWTVLMIYVPKHKTGQRNISGAYIYINKDCWCVSTSNLYVHLKPQYPVNKCCHLSLVTVSVFGSFNHMQGSAINCQVLSPLYSIHSSVHSLSCTFCEPSDGNRLSRVVQTSLCPALHGWSWGTSIWGIPRCPQARFSPGA